MRKKIHLDHYEKKLEIIETRYRQCISKHLIYPIIYMKVHFLKQHIIHVAPVHIINQSIESIPNPNSF
jgi:hypothetical protein